MQNIQFVPGVGIFHIPFIVYMRFVVVSLHGSLKSIHYTLSNCADSYLNFVPFFVLILDRLVYLPINDGGSGQKKKIRL